MLRVYFGEEDFLVSKAIKSAKKEFVEKNPQALVEVFDGGESQVKDFLSSLSQGGGLFVQKKLVIVQDVFDFNKSDQEKILEFLKSKNLSGEVELIVTWRGKIKVSKLMNFLKKNGECQEYKKSTPREAEKFVAEKIKNVCTINRNALNKIIILFGSNLWLLDKELEKLINFKNGGEITEADVNEMCEGGVSVKIFDLVDAIGTQNKKRALELLESLLSQGEDGFYVLSMMIFQIRNLALVYNCKEKGIFNPSEIAKITGLHPYVTQKTFSQLRSFSGEKIRELYNRAFFLDINSKSGKIEIKEALKEFIIKI